MESDSGGSKGIGLAGAAAFTAGLAILAPGFKDAALVWLDHKTGLHLYDPPPLVGWVLLILGVSLLLLSYFGARRVSGAVSSVYFRDRGTIGEIVAIKQTGFIPGVPDLQRDELPYSLRNRSVNHLRIDVSQELSSQPPDLERALRTQLAMPEQLAAIRGATPTADLAYCGIVQAPFQLLAGYQLSSWSKVFPFEWDRNEHHWKTLAPGLGPDLAIATRTEAAPGQRDVAIAVEVSYSIATRDIILSVPDLVEIVRIGPRVPRLDCVRHQGQATALAKSFREALDAVHQRRLQGQRVHVFCAAPMSVGFSLGRLISRTLHPPVTAYAYDAQAAKPYHWGVFINPGQGSAQIVRP